MLGPLHAREGAKALALFQSVQFPTREVVAGLSARPALRHGARVLFVNDPFAKDSYLLIFATRLYYRDLTIEVVRAPEAQPGFDAVFAFEGRSLRLTSGRG
jgi:hypothetical protein